MLRKLGVVLAAVLLALSVPFTAARAIGPTQEAAKARAMLERAIAEVKANRDQALEEFTKGQNGFADGYLYPFCARARSGWVVAHPQRLGDNLAEIADVNGKLFGKEILQTAVEGQIKEIHYMWPKPGQKTPSQKDTFYEKVGNLVCAVGYYP